MSTKEGKHEDKSPMSNTSFDNDWRGVGEPINANLNRWGQSSSGCQRSALGEDIGIDFSCSSDCLEEIWTLLAHRDTSNATVGKGCGCAAAADQRQITEYQNPKNVVMTKPSPVHFYPQHIGFDLIFND